MKNLLAVLVLLFVFLSCQHTPATPASSEASEAEAESIDSVAKATAIFWVDKTKRTNATVRTVKAKVLIKPSGKVDLQFFVKEQPVSVRKYLIYRLDIFRVSKMMLDSGFVKTGEQYVQLRYRPDLAQRFNL